MQREKEEWKRWKRISKKAGTISNGEIYVQWKYKKKKKDKRRQKKNLK